jgi:hypothetical protein
LSALAIAEPFAGAAEAGEPSIDKIPPAIKSIRKNLRILSPLIILGLADLDQRKTTSIKSRIGAEGAGRKHSRVNVAYGKIQRSVPPFLNLAPAPPPLSATNSTRWRRRSRNSIPRAKRR